MNETTNTTETTTPATYEKVMAQLEAARKAAKEARALLATLPKPPRTPRTTLPALETREGLFAGLWARGLSYHGADSRPLSVADMRAAIATWNGEHGERDTRLADIYAKRKLIRAKLSKGAGKGKGARGGDLSSPFRPSTPRRETAEERARRRAEEEARALFEAAGYAPTAEQFEAAVAAHLARHAKPSKPSATPAA